jgi:hypothetical protein
MMEGLANFQIKYEPNVNLIGLEVCWDGTTPFKRTIDKFGLSFVPFLTFCQHYHCGQILVEYILHSSLQRQILFPNLRNQNHS